MLQNNVHEAALFEVFNVSLVFVYYSPDLASKLIVHTVSIFVLIVPIQTLGDNCKEYFCCPTDFSVIFSICLQICSPVSSGMSYQVVNFHGAGFYYGNAVSPHFVYKVFFTSFAGLFLLQHLVCRAAWFVPV